MPTVTVSRLREDGEVVKESVFPAPVMIITGGYSTFTIYDANKYPHFFKINYCKGELKKTIIE